MKKFDSSSELACLPSLPLSQGSFSQADSLSLMDKAQGGCKDEIYSERHGNLAVRNAFRNDWRTMSRYTSKERCFSRWRKRVQRNRGEGKEREGGGQWRGKVGKQTPHRRPRPWSGEPR